MDRKTIDKCLLIMKKIKKHAISSIFDEPVDPIRDKAPDYLEKVRKPMDLTTISRKLENRKYKEIKEWKEDLYLIAKNAIEYNGKKKPIGVVALELKSLLRKYVDGFREDGSPLWFNELNIIRTSIKDMVKDKVSVLQDEEEASIVNPKLKTKDLDTKPEVKRFVIHSLPVEELKILQYYLYNIANIDFRQRVYNIILEYSPEQIMNGVVNLNLLTPKALIELKNACFEYKDKISEVSDKSEKVEIINDDETNGNLYEELFESI